MKKTFTIVACCFIASTLLAACSQDSDAVDPEAVVGENLVGGNIVEENLPATSSFNMRNREIREEMLAEFTANNIEYWINDDGSIGYNMVDAEAIDTIGNLIRAEYIHRN